MIPKRWQFAFLLMSGTMMGYCLRVNISSAISKMKVVFNWTESQKGLVLSAFYWGYTLGQVPISRYMQYHEAKLVFGLTILIPSILTIFVPAACHTNFALALLIRSLIGFLQSATFPCIYHFLPSWIPLNEKTIMVATILTGPYLGEIFAFSVSGKLVSDDYIIGNVSVEGWESVFYLFGFLGILWFPIWMYFAAETPEVHKYITQEEIDYIKKGKNYLHVNEDDAYYSNTLDNPLLSADSTIPTACYDQQEDIISDNNNAIRQISILSTESKFKHEIVSRTPWKKFFTHPAILTLFVANFLNGWIGFLLLSELPSYFEDILGFNSTAAGTLLIAPYLALFISTLLFGIIFEYFQQKKGMHTRTVHQYAQYIAFGGGVMFLNICVYLRGKYSAYACIIAAQCCLGASQSGLLCCYLDIAPNYSSILSSIGNTLASLAGIIGPLVVAIFINKYEGVDGWRAMFLLTAIMTFITLLLWVIYQTSTIDPRVNNPSGHAKERVDIKKDIKEKKINF